MSDVETRIGPVVVTWSRPSLMRLLYFAIPAPVLFGLLYGYGEIGYYWSLFGAVLFMAGQRVFNP